MDAGRSRSARLWFLVTVTLGSLGVLPVQPAAASPGLVTEDISGPLEPEDLAQELAGAGVSVSNVTYQGAEVAAGKFSGGTGIIGFEEGIVLGSGNIADVVGPNEEDGVTTGNDTPGDADLTLLSGNPTFDAAVLEFDFVPDQNQVFFSYVFSSDEYNEFVNTEFNDVFAFFVNGTNCAVVNSDPVSINTINNGNPFGTEPRSHPELYRNNDLDDGGGSIDTEMDGLTVVLTCESSVNANETNHMKLAIADASDSSLDSNVFLQKGSLTTDVTPPTCRLVARRAGPPAEIDVEVQDQGSGLASVEVSKVSNANVNVPPFSTGTTDPVIVTATKIDQSKRAFVGLLLTDVAGNRIRCPNTGFGAFIF